MLFPTQTSLLPVTVALTNFLEKVGWKAFSLNYPYWYLGTTPYKFLVGPFVPILESLIHKLIPNVSLFNITIYLVICSYFLSVWGWILLIKKIKEIDKKSILLILVFLIVFPWRLFSSIALSEGTATVAQNLLPFVLYAFWNYLEKKGRLNFIWAALATLLILLINTNVLPVFIVGAVSLAITEAYREGKVRRVGQELKRVLLPFACGFILATFWYTPSYWWTILVNPSVGGASGLKVLVRIFDLLRGYIPLVLAIVAVYFVSKIKERITVFTLVWLLTFTFLSLFRFLSDPDFWMDWTAWMGELEIGFVFLLTLINIKFKPLKAILFLVPFLLTFYAYTRLGKPSLITKEIPKGAQSLSEVANLTGTKRVFLSGTTVFWANALTDIYQVRGGKDEVSKDPSWAKGAWVIRESPSIEETKLWIKNLGVSYVLVHGPKSPEFFHDFKNLGKWEGTGIRGSKILEDILYTF